MARFWQVLLEANEAVNSVVWGMPVIALIIGAGLLFTIKTGFFQFKRMGHVLSSTIIPSLKRDKSKKNSDKKSISQFQAVSGALAATIGTGNITGVATAITAGGPGAVFWMWISALLGMMTIFAENVLGIHYRQRDKNGVWQGGPMYYIERGLGAKRGFRHVAKPLAVAFAFFCMCASFGIGNMTQANSISTALEGAFAVPPLVTGITLAVAAFFVIIGGVKRIGAVAEKLVPFMAGAYIICTLAVFFVNYREIPNVFTTIFQSAFGLDAIAGGISGIMVKQAVTMGFKRGIFSNEAGLGSSVIISCAADVEEPVVQGMWGIFQVLVDTIVICTLTAFVILSTGVVGARGADGALLQGNALVAEAFSSVFGGSAGGVLAVSVVFFAFATVIGWSYFGEKAALYLFGKKAALPYRLIYVAFVVVGAMMELNLVWSISDTLNGLMALPNMIALLCLSGVVFKLTADYLGRLRGDFSRVAAPDPASPLKRS